MKHDCIECHRYIDESVIDPRRVSLVILVEESETTFKWFCEYGGCVFQFKAKTQPILILHHVIMFMSAETADLTTFLERNDYYANIRN